MASYKMIFFLYFFANLAFPLPWQPINQIQRLYKNMRLVENYLINISEKHLLRRDSNKCHGNQSNEQVKTKLICLIED